MKILICGDSFAADWSILYPRKKGWPNLLADRFNITNIAQAGCSEYKILLQLLSVDLTQFDKIIVSHTGSHRRIYVKCHPVYENDPFHKDSDLIYSDIKHHCIKNKKLLPLIEYFEKYFDLEHAKFMHSLILKEIYAIVENYNVLHISHLEEEELSNCVSFYDILKTNKGLINHYSELGNQIVYEKIVSLIFL